MAKQMTVNKTDKDYKVFKISDLEEVKISNIDDQDSFLITDYQNGKHFTKRISIERLMKVIGNSPEVIKQLLADEELDQQIQEKVDEALNITIIDGGTANTVTQ